MKYLALFIFTLAGCTTPNRSTNDLTNLRDDQIVLVGRLSIDQKMPESTNVIDTIGVTEGGILRASSSPQAVVETKTYGFENGDILVKWGELFSVPYAKSPVIYVNGIFTYLYDRNGPNNFFFPVGGTIRTRGTRRYIYIGHISLHLDDFYVMKSVKVIDEFDKDSALLARFKGIQKSLFQPVTMHGKPAEPQPQGQPPQELPSHSDLE